MNGGPAPDPYFEAVEEAFNRRRGAPLILSPRDWGLIDDWKRRGVPLRLVVQGVENCFDAFDRRPPTARRVNSLSYCRQEVLSLFEIHLLLHGAEAGRPGADDAPAAAAAAQKLLGRHLAKLGRQLREAITAVSLSGSADRLVGLLAETAAELRRLRKDLKSAPLDPQQLEQELARLDAAVLHGSRGAMTAEELQELERTALETLKPAASRMRPEALETTRQAAAARLLRRRFRLPRLTLFD